MAHRKGRIEDARLTRGAGRYGDDRPKGDAVFGVFVRSDMASALLRGIDTSGAREMEGVIAVLTGADLAADGVGPVQVPFKMDGPDGRVWTSTDRSLLVTDRVRHVGEPLALVIAKTRAAAMDAAEAVTADLDDLPAVTTLDEARAEGAALVHEGRAGNLCAQWAHGDWEAAGSAIDASAHQVSITVPITRVTTVAMEPRNAYAAPLGEGRFELYCSHQNPIALRGAVAAAFDMEPAQIQCHAGDVGGAFGMKSGPLREELLIFWAARRLGRAVQWCATRSEDFLIDEAGRDMRFTCRLGLSETGEFTAMQFDAEFNVGAYASLRSIVMVSNFGGVAGVYRTPLIAGRMSAWLTHTVPTAPYRGAGRPEATLAVEALIDAAAHQCGFDPVELRRQNLIRAEEMPWKSPFIFDYDCGDFARVMDKGLARADWEGFAARHARAAARGKVRGRGIALCIETAGGIFGNPGQDFTNVEFLADGSVTLDVGTFSAGSGLETSLTDLAATALEIAPERITYRQGDTDILDHGKGMGGSAAMPQGAPALRDGVAKALEAARALACDVLEADTRDIVYESGAFRIDGTDRAVTLQALAQTAAERGIRLRGEGSFAPAAPTFPNGCHICEVEIDPETGKCEIMSYTGIEDIGTVINAQLAEGQIHGGVVQGLGQILCEEIRLSPQEGQLLSGSFMDYAMPRASDVPFLTTGFEPVPTKVNPLGAKGVGEAGTVGALAAGFNALRDAMRQLGVQSFDMPASPGRVWQAIHEARG
ncbi:xanthine dehydrogenase family protein molybdopterin-binding subunit [Litorivita sp. NS0012-18]|uniref:xanthine dehydrogenase family protein molybdopterin-binding subunit n=1 Tax=Litorivita sp. NS0012-18 TaxID=3127655 RepID=UPI003109409C